jgi:hypothetical protein
MMKTTLILICLLIHASAFAKEHRVPTPAGEIVFTTEDKEVSQRNFFGADLWFTGEVIKDKRNVMSIVYSTKDVQLNPEVKNNEFEKHKAEMTKFAQGNGYSNISFRPYKFHKVNDQLAYHSLVWSYKIEDFEYLEESYYVECNNILFIAKATTHFQSKSDQSKFKKIIESARCMK